MRPGSARETPVGHSVAVRRDLVDDLVCPATGGGLRLECCAGAGDAVEFGLLHGDLRSYPLIGGIPVFAGDTGPLVELVRQGRYGDAITRAAYGHLTWSRMREGLGGLAPVLGRGKRLVRAVDRHLQNRELRRGAPLVVGAEAGPPGVEALEHAYLRARHPNPHGFDYFTKRVGTPRYLVALALLESIPATSGRVLDVGCGLGHLTWAAGQRSPAADTVGVDTEFLSLLYAQARVSPSSAFVCADARWLPFRTGRFALAVSSDVLPYVTEKRAVLQEMGRVLTPEGTLLLTALRNRLAAHVHGGEPLSPEGWRGIVDHLEHRVYADAEVLDAYLQRRAPTPVPVTGVADAQTLSIVASRLPLVAEEGFEQWPHARGSLAVHPLLGVSRTLPCGGVEYVRRFPSPSYERDHPLLATYLPERVTLVPAVVDQARTTRAGPELEAALACVAVLGMPGGIVEDPWPGLASSAGR